MYPDVSMPSMKLALVGALCGASLLCLFARVDAQAATTAIDCGRLTDRASVVEKQVCLSPALLEANNDIDRLTSALESVLRGADRDALVDTAMPFLRTRNSCSNEDATLFGGHDEAVRSCVSRVLATRRAALVAARSTPASIRSAIQQYSLIDVAFFRKYAELIEGRAVQVFGCLVYAPGPVIMGPMRGGIHASCDDDGPDVPMVFVNDRTASNVSSDGWRISFWRGTVQKTEGRWQLDAQSPTLR